MIRSYDSAVAEEVGVNAAVLFQHIAWWCEHNRANNANIRGGKAWTFNSQKAFEELFPEFSRQNIRTAVSKLKEKGFIETGSFNKSAYDRTVWYTIGPRGIEMTGNQKSPSERLESTNVIGQNQPLSLVGINQPIPVDYQVTTSSSPLNAPQEQIPFKEIVSMLNEKCGTSFRASSESTKKHIRARWGEGYRLDDFERVIDNKLAEWGSNPEMRPFLRPQTLFGTKFEGYLNQAARPKGVDYSAYD